MIKEVLKDKEPIAYLSLKNDLNSDRLAHCYLLYGELNPLKTETAFLLAQSIIEDKKDYACEICDTCRRIKDNKYFDVIYVDGYKHSITKEDIENIMDEFNRTSLEKSDKKIYIISNINNANPKVLNMILKFIEEPSSNNTYGIFTSDNIDTLLSTIVSRCKKIPFKTTDFSHLIKDYIDAGFDDTDAYLLSKIKHSFDNQMDLNDDKYLNAKEYVYKMIESLNNPKYIPVLFSKEFYTSVNRDDFKETSDYFLDIMLIMLEDSFVLNYLDDQDYNKHLKLLSESDPSKLLKIFEDAKDKTNSYINRQLLFDQIGSQIILY